VISFPHAAPPPGDDAATISARRAGVVTRDLSGLDEMRLVDGLFQSIWGAGGAQVAMPVNLLQALVHSGNYVAGAWRGGALVGAGVAFLADRQGEIELHSHVAGVTRSDQGCGVGLALKLHQRSWALARGIQQVTWTYDPLVRRNGWFNLVKLQARATSYFPDFYGVTEDDVNGTDETDRCMVTWELGRPFSLNLALPSAPHDATVALIASANHVPVAHQVRLESGSAIMCQVPEDIMAVRRRDPGLAREWRLALRATMGAAMDAGYSAKSITRDGWYLLERD
jgi:predicted GNAT superfamily acetyltransferase